LWEKICRQKSHNNFSGKFGEIRAKIIFAIAPANYCSYTYDHYGERKVSLKPNFIKLNDESFASQHQQAATNLQTSFHTAYFTPTFYCSVILTNLLLSIWLFERVFRRPMKDASPLIRHKHDCAP